MEVLHEKGIEFTFEIVGSFVTAADESYTERLKERVKKSLFSDRITFTGVVPYNGLPKVYQRNNLFLNLSQTGSMDKTVPEAMSSGLGIVTSNEAFKDLLVPVSLDKDEIAEQIISGGVKSMRDWVIRENSLGGLIKKIKKGYEIS